MGGAEVQIRGAKATIQGQVNIRPLTCATDSPDICDRSSRLLGIVSGNLSQLQQRSGTFDLLVQLRNAGIEIDPRQIRQLTCNDEIDICDRATRQLGITGRNWNLNSSTDSVTIVNTPSSPVMDFNQALNVARMATNTHTFTATGNFRLSSIEASASGSMRVEIKSGSTGSETVKMVAFTSPSKPTIQINFDEELQLSSGQRIQIVRTNRENQKMDVYSTVLGFNM